MSLRDFARGIPERTGATGRASERHVAKRLAADLTLASGAIEGRKGDMSTTDWLIEAKSTVNLSISLKYDWLDKISREAQGVAKTPALTVSFTHGDGRPIYHGAWVLIPASVFEELVRGR